MTAAGPVAAPRLTIQRRLIEGALREAGRAVGAVELFEALRTTHPRLGRATVFRTLDLLVDLGLAQRFEGDGHVHLYTSCDPIRHHHHLVCRRCGATADIDDREVERLIVSMRRRHGFVLDHDTLDFYGTCAACAGSPDDPQSIPSIS